MNESKSGMGFFEKYLTIWVLLCMAVGILIGNFPPGIPNFLGWFEYAQVSIPIAVLIWLVIFPMMLWHSKPVFLCYLQSHNPR